MPRIKLTANDRDLEMEITDDQLFAVIELLSKRMKKVNLSEHAFDLEKSESSSHDDESLSISDNADKKIIISELEKDIEHWKNKYYSLTKRFTSLFEQYRKLNNAYATTLFFKDSYLLELEAVQKELRNNTKTESENSEKCLIM